MYNSHTWETLVLVGFLNMPYHTFQSLPLCQIIFCFNEKQNEIFFSLLSLIFILRNKNGVAGNEVRRVSRWRTLVTFMEGYKIL